MDTFRAQAEALRAALVDRRRDLHRHPELAFNEVRTAGIAAAALNALGLEVRTGVGQTGVIGLLEGGQPGPVVLVRCDMDALPIVEENDTPYCSQAPGRMHACGHDGHVAMLLAAAKHFATQRNFDGTVYLIFQPAEEGGGGAREMIRDGLFGKFPMEAIFGMHNWPGLATGQFALKAGPVMGSSTEFRVTIRGRGSHAALPHDGIDPVPVACQMVQAFQTIITRNKRPIEAAVLSVTMIHAGEATNVVPDTAEIQGTLRTFTVETIDLVEQRMRALVEHTAAAFGCTAELEFVRNYPPTINHTAETDFCREVMKEVVGEANVLEFEPTLGAEDFAYFLLEKPGCYVVIGNGEGAHREAGHGLGPCTLHNPNYDFNDELIPIGASYWVHLAERWLAPR